MAAPWEKYQSQGTQVKPADPRIPYQLQQEQGQAAAAPYAAPKAQAELARTRQQMELDARTAPAEMASKTAQARKATVEADVLEKTGGAGVEQSKAGGFYSRATKANDIYGKTGVGAPSFGRQVAKAVLPDAIVNNFTDDARQAAEAVQRDFIAATLRYESGAAIPPEELESQRAIYFPMTGDSEQTIALKAQLRQNAIEALKIGAGPAADHITPTSAIANATEQGQYYAPPQVEAAQGQFRREYDGKTAGALDRLIRMGRPVNEIVAYAKSKGFNPPSPAEVMEAQKYNKLHPEYKGSYVDAQRIVPTTAAERIASSPLSAFVNGAGTAMTAGLNDEMVGGLTALTGGSYQEGRDAFNAKKGLVADANPVSDFAGSLAGSIAGMRGVSALGNKVGGRTQSVLNGRGGLGADMAYGAAYGAGQNNEDRLRGAALGAGAAGAGNMVGRGLGASIAGAISPTGGRLAGLYAMGVRPSIGQRVGGRFNEFEQKLESMPFVGDAIKGTRQRARDQFQTGLFNDALGEIGQQLPPGVGPGPGPHSFAQQAFDTAYDSARGGMTAVADDGMGQALGQLQRSVSTLRRESQGQFDKIWSGAVGRRFLQQNGQLSGDAYKKAMSELNSKASAIRKNPNGDHELAATLEEAMGVLRDSAVRNSPPEAVAAMNAADKGYAKLVRIEDAARRRGGGSGEFSPTQYDAAVQNMGGGVRSRGYLSGDALNFDIAKAGLQLGETIPNSGSFDRFALPMTAAGAGWLEPTTLAPLIGYGLLNSPGLRNITTNVMAPRNVSPVAQEIADKLRLLNGPLGAAGAGTSLALTSGR